MFRSQLTQSHLAVLADDEKQFSYWQERLALARRDLAVKRAADPQDRMVPFLERCVENYIKIRDRNCQHQKMTKQVLTVLGHEVTEVSLSKRGHESEDEPDPVRRRV